VAYTELLFRGSQLTRTARPNVKTEGRGGEKFLEGAFSPSAMGRGLEEHCKLPQWRLGGDPEAKRFRSILTAMDNT